MIALLSAAQDYRQALSTFIDLVRTNDNKISEGEISQGEAYQQAIANASLSILLREPITSSSTILLEAQHFKHARSRNIRKAEKMRENRAAERAGEPRPDRGQSRGLLFPEFGAISPEELDAKRTEWLARRQAPASPASAKDVRGRVEADPNYEEAEIEIEAEE
jgi:hypothetical protein